MEREQLPRVLLAADDHDLAGQLDREFPRHDFVVCAHVTHAESVVESAIREKPDVCVVDLDLPGGGTAAMSAIGSALPAASSLALGAADDGRAVLEAVLSGARGYLIKPCDPEQMAHGVETLLRGEIAIDAHLLGRLLDELEVRELGRRRRSRMRQVLTERELEVLELLSDGLDTRQIAEELFVTPVTVRSHVAAITRKLGVPDRTGAATRFVDDLRPDAT